MNQTFAIFADAYRELNAKRLFWITLLISGVLVVTFALVGVEPGGITFLKWHFAQPNAATFYKAFLLKFVLVDVWLTWAATILALISTAGIFPDFLAGGSIDLYLSKPISRLRLFVTKFAAGLLFATLQVTIFTAGMFLVVGVRLGEWKPSLLLGIPIVVCFYTYLYVVCVLLGVVTRSTVAALLLTLIAWVMFWAVNSAEVSLLSYQHAQENRLARFEARARDADAQARRAEAASSLFDRSVFRGFTLRAPQPRAQHDKYVRLADETRDAIRTLSRFHHFLYEVATALPKTGPTIDLLERHLLRDRDVETMRGGDEELPEGLPNFTNADDSVLFDLPARITGERKARREVRARPLGWVVGTSLIFPGVVFVLAAWVFCRRDY